MNEPYSTNAKEEEKKKKGTNFNREKDSGER